MRDEKKQGTLQSVDTEIRFGRNIGVPTFLRLRVLGWAKGAPNGQRNLSPMSILRYNIFFG